jgi:hypothetical protein
VGGVYSQVLQDVLHRVDRAFGGFFARVRRGDRPGFPRFRAAHRFDSLTYPQLGFRVHGRHLQLSKVGAVKIKRHRPMEGRIKTLTITREAGKWFAGFSGEVEPRPLPPSTECHRPRCRPDALRDLERRHPHREPALRAPRGTADATGATPDRTPTEGQCPTTRSRAVVPSGAGACRPPAGGYAAQAVAPAGGPLWPDRRRRVEHQGDGHRDAGEAGPRCRVGVVHPETRVQERGR